MLNAFNIDLTKGKFIMKKLWRGVIKRSREIKAKPFLDFLDLFLFKPQKLLKAKGIETRLLI
jgi:hypothetical protein